MNSLRGTRGTSPGEGRGCCSGSLCCPLPPVPSGQRGLGAASRSRQAAGAGLLPRCRVPGPGAAQPLSRAGRDGAPGPATLTHGEGAGFEQAELFPQHGWVRTALGCRPRRTRCPLQPGTLPVPVRVRQGLVGNPRRMVNNRSSGKPKLTPEAVTPSLTHAPFPSHWGLPYVCCFQQ